MSNQIIEKLLAKTKRSDIPAFAPGDTVRVNVKIKEGDKERLQAFEGVVIARSHGPHASFTVRKMSFGQGVELEGCGVRAGGGSNRSRQIATWNRTRASRELRKAAASQAAEKLQICTRRGGREFCSRPRPG